VSFISYCNQYALETLYFIAGTRKIINSELIDSTGEIIALNNYTPTLYIYPYGDKDNPIDTLPNGLVGSLIFTSNFSYKVKFILTPDITENLGGKYVYKIVLSKKYLDYNINTEYGEMIISPAIPYTTPGD
jgi:hypothetical protein